MTEVTLFTKSDLDRQLAEIEAIGIGDVPTKLVEGKQRPVNVAIHKRKLRRQITKDHEQSLLEKLIAVLVEAGYSDAEGIMQFGVFAIHRDGFQSGEEIG